jgi:hypothetical protein
MTNLTHFSQCIYFTPLHVSSNKCSSSGGSYCVNTSSGIIHTSGSCVLVRRELRPDRHTRQSPTRLYYIRWCIDTIWLYRSSQRYLFSLLSDRPYFHLAPCPVDNGAVFRRSKRPGCETELWLPSTVWVMNSLSHFSSLSHIFVCNCFMNSREIGR